MKNYIQKGDAITLTAQSAVFAGQGVLQGALFGVAATNASAGEEFEAILVGVYSLPKANGEDALAPGDPVYWSDDLGRVTTASADTKRIGAVTQAAPAEAGFVSVRLNGVA